MNSDLVENTAAFVPCLARHYSWGPPSCILVFDHHRLFRLLFWSRCKGTGLFDCLHLPRLSHDAMACELFASDVWQWLFGRDSVWQCSELAQNCILWEFIYRHSHKVRSRPERSCSTNSRLNEEGWRIQIGDNCNGCHDWTFKWFLTDLEWPLLVFLHI